jgi:hypothetical protein
MRGEVVSKKSEGDTKIDTDAFNVTDLASQHPKKGDVKLKRPKTDGTFVLLPYKPITQAYGKLTAAGYAVMIELARQHFKGFGKNPVTLSNQTGLGAMGMHRGTKVKALRQLQAVGLVRYSREGQEAYRVTLLWHPIRR